MLGSKLKTSSDASGLWQPRPGTPAATATATARFNGRDITEWQLYFLLQGINLHEHQSDAQIQ